MGDGINDGLELAKKCIEQVFEPFKDVAHSLLSPAATQVGLSFGDQAAFWRSKRLLRFREAFYQYALAHGLKVKPVSPRLLFPICENACLEDDENLYTRWITLLANAATDCGVEVLPCFPDILKQLTAEEAQFLDSAYNETTIGAEKRRTEVLANNPTVKMNGELAGSLGISGRILNSVNPVMIDNLERLRLVTRNMVPLSVDDKVHHTFPPANHLYVSELGKAFVRACREPESV
jgi:hypothetical protein